MGIWGIRMGLGNWRRLGYVVQGDVAITEHRVCWYIHIWWYRLTSPIRAPKACRTTSTVGW